LTLASPRRCDSDWLTNCAWRVNGRLTGAQKIGLIFKKWLLILANLAWVSLDECSLFVRKETEGGF
jgi:hypothetical protein